jgi:ribose 5-phosphate isomerase B
LKERLVKYLKQSGHKVIDKGDEILDPEDDFMVFATRVVNAINSSDSKDARGILICGSGQGMAIAANRHKGIRAALGWSKLAAEESRNDEDSNVLAIPAEILDQDEEWQPVVDAWLSTPFAGAARYKRRNRQLDEL